MIQQFHSWVYIQKKTKTKTLIQIDTFTPMFIAALFTVAKIRKQPKCPSINGWIKKMWCIYTKEYYSAIKKERDFAICSNKYSFVSGFFHLT